MLYRHLEDNCTQKLIWILTGLLTFVTISFSWFLNQPPLARVDVVIRTIQAPAEPQPSMMDVLTVAMVVSRETGEKSPDAAWQQIVDTVRNRTDVTGRSVSEELRVIGCSKKTGKCAAMFSPMNGAGPVWRVTKDTLPRYAGLLEKAARVLRVPKNPQWSATHFDGVDFSPPSWSKDFTYLGTDHRTHYWWDEGESSYRKARVPKDVIKIKPRLRKTRVSTVNPVKCRLRKILRAMS